MSRSRHPRGVAKRLSAHRRKMREWKGDSVWRPGERDGIAEKHIRRSSRKRVRNASQDGGSLNRVRLLSESQATNVLMVSTRREIRAAGFIVPVSSWELDAA